MLRFRLLHAGRQAASLKQRNPIEFVSMSCWNVSVSPPPLPSTDRPSAMMVREKKGEPQTVRVGIEIQEMPEVQEFLQFTRAIPD